MVVVERDTFSLLRQPVPSAVLLTSPVNPLPVALVPLRLPPLDYLAQQRLEGHFALHARKESPAAVREIDE